MKYSLEYDGEIPDNMTYGYVVDDGKYFLYNSVRYENGLPSHYEAERSTLNASKARSVFEDGTPASEVDLILIRHQSVDNYYALSRCICEAFCL